MKKVVDIEKLMSQSKTLGTKMGYSVWLLIWVVVKINVKIFRN